MKYVCELCGMVYDEDIGDPKHGYPAGTKLEDLPEDYECTGCGSRREAFDPVKPKKNTASKTPDFGFWHEKYQGNKQESDR